MKLLILTIFAALGFACVLCADETAEISLTTNEQTAVRQQLQAFDRGEITLEETTEPGGESGCQKLVAYHLMHTNDVTTKMKLPISRRYGAMGKYQDAVRLAQEYVGVYSNDWHGWRILGSANLFMNNFNAALHAYTNAVRLGDDLSYAALGLAALKTDRLDIVSNMVPRLVALKTSKLTSRNQSLQLATDLVIYSLRTNQKDLFMKAVEGFDPKEILAHDDVAFLVKQGCEQFKGGETDRLCQKLETAGKSGVKPPQ